MGTGGSGEVGRQAQVVTLPGAGHIPHVTHPDAYVATIVAFMRETND
jgi:pimeloyl-ACP methyl ester carboxylesterase